ncbi:hypothetical protein ACKRZS_007911 [Fusarium odoratissimum]
MVSLDPNLYNVAWIATLEIEARCALHMLDERYDGRFPMGRGDDYIFHAGSICGHNVVIATLPAGQEYGTGSAAALASQVKKSFPNLWFGLLVGVAAGLPKLTGEEQKQRDIRLGDILVALPDGENAGLIAYDLGKVTGRDAFQPLRLGHALAATEAVVRAAIGSIKLGQPNESEVFLPYYERIKDMQHATGTFIDPGQDQDQFYEFESGQQREVERPQRPKDQRTRVWYGSIGSGDKLVRNASRRNELRDKYNIIGLEMEAAGTMNRIPVGVIRGVCDYGDENKNKDWQPYAAAMAAAYAKAILKEIPPETRTVRSQNYAQSGTLVNRRGKEPNKRSYEDYFASCENEQPSMRDIAASDRQVKSSRQSFGSQTLQLTSSGVTQPPRQRRTLGDASATISSQKPANLAWPEYQNERPGLAFRFLERDDIPAAIGARSDAWLTAGRRTPWTAVIYGLTGVGKSQACLRAIMDNETKFRGIFYVDASNDTSASSNYLEIAQVCGAQSHWEGIELDEKIRLTRAYLACHEDPWLLMIDNADSESVALTKYIPTGGSGTILITTSDERMATSSNAFGKIGPMDERNALDLLMSYKRPGIALDETEQDAARLIAVDLLGGLPLAIAQAGSYIFNKYCTYAEYCDDFRRSPQTPLSYELEQWPNYRRPIWTTFNLSLSRIQSLPEQGSAQAVELLRTLSFLHHEGIQERLFQETWANMKDTPTWSQHISLFDSSGPCWDTLNLRAAFEILCRYSLLDRSVSPSRQYSMHRLVQIVSKETMSLEEQAKYALQAISIIAVALCGIETPLSWIENPSGFELQKTLLPHIRACVEDRLESIFQNGVGQSQGIKMEMLLLHARAYSSTGLYSGARNILTAVCERLEIVNIDGVVNPIALQAMEQTAACDACLGQHLKACELRKRILSVYRTDCQQPGDIDVAMINLADSLWMTGNRTEALELSQEVLRRREESLKEDDPRLSRTRRKVAEYLHGSYSRRKALDLRERVFADIGQQEYKSEVEYLDQLTIRNALADSYQWDGQLLKARNLRGDVYDGRLKTLGPEHPDTLLAHERLLGIKARLDQTTNTRREICQQREWIVKSWKKMFGDEHPYTLEARVNLGHSYSAVEQWKKALGEQKSVLEIRTRQVLEQKLPSNELSYLSSLGNVANILVKAGYMREALVLRKKALNVAKEYYGANGRITLRLANHVATCHASRDTKASHRKALSMRRSILEKQKSHLTVDDPDILTTMSFLAADLANVNEWDESIQVRRDLLAKQKSVLGERNHQTLMNTKKLALALAGSVS